MGEGISYTLCEASSADMNYDARNQNDPGIIMWVLYCAEINSNIKARCNHIQQGGTGKWQKETSFQNTIRIPFGTYKSEPWLV